ncbi:sporulation protein YpjB [Paenibacillus sp. GD4]|uniref:sporulation protein YpjB n=1 Tax=Paenibacillus sp. GD4 TaxID=3068890 RepID=UPI0027965221|nr:sporulation protein YpjB [Paenibacillus sp. GD4]MDQ1909390.1 sporulation protein YpjB [Paenibacillus sp. GD4]
MFFAMRRKWTGLIAVLALASQVLIGCGQAVRSEGEAAPKPSQEQLQRVELLNQTADEMYKKVMQGDVAGGKVVLQQLSDQVTQIRFEGITSLEGINALTETVTEAKKVFNAAQFSQEEGQVSTAKIRLATDALTHTNNPMWLQYYKLLLEDVEGLESAAKNQQKTELQKVYRNWEQHYGIIHPSLLISRNPSDVEKLDSLTVFMKQQILSAQDPYTQMLQILPQVRQSLDKLFMKKEATAYLPMAEPQNPILWTLTIGSVILAALIFAGWRLSKKDDGLVTVRKPEEG